MSGPRRDHRTAGGRSMWSLRRSLLEITKDLGFSAAAERVTAGSVFDATDDHDSITHVT
jgi:hypothetical protein